MGVLILAFSCNFNSQGQGISLDTIISIPMNESIQNRGVKLDANSAKLYVFSTDKYLPNELYEIDLITRKFKKIFTNFVFEDFTKLVAAVDGYLIFKYQKDNLLFFNIQNDTLKLRRSLPFIEQAGELIVKNDIIYNAFLYNLKPKSKSMSKQLSISNSEGKPLKLISLEFKLIETTHFRPFSYFYYQDKYLYHFQATKPEVTRIDLENYKTKSFIPKISKWKNIEETAYYKSLLKRRYSDMHDVFDSLKEYEVGKADLVKFGYRTDNNESVFICMPTEHYGDGISMKDFMRIIVSNELNEVVYDSLINFSKSLGDHLSLYPFDDQTLYYKQKFITTKQTLIYDEKGKGIENQKPVLYIGIFDFKY